MLRNHPNPWMGATDYKKPQYWNGSAYADVPGAGAYTLAKNAYDTVAFTATSTNRLRVLLTGPGSSSVGLLEVRAYGS
ncbi:hypothetical protein GCM10027187_29650 [Streptosporangium sandarakinum]